MTQPDQYDTGRVALCELSPRLENFNNIAASLFSGRDSLCDTPWVETEPPKHSILEEGLKGWCAKQWPSVRASAAKRLEEAKRRMLS
jgi:hypothetical protein